ncbi:MAG TPA: acyltransferase family protein [Rugosimonospora sp.]|nr:acyltransferase family protein [Rugosimonospora sp.]
MLATLEARTPATRDRAIDGLRALALLGVVIGHWLVMPLIPDASGALHVSSPLRALPAFAPVSWMLQMLGLFFLVGGYVAARGYRGGYRPWLRTRLLRLGRPVLALAVALAAGLPLLYLCGVPAGTLRTTLVLTVQPLWFLGVYAVVTALTPVIVALVRRFGVLAAVPPVLVVAAVDLLRYGPWQHAVPGWVGLVNVLPGWAFGYVLGVAWAYGRLGRRAAALLAAGGGVLALLLVARFGYPVSMVGVPGSARTNSHPPSLLVVALAAAQCGLAVLLRDRLAALLRRPAWWGAAVLVNLGALTILCWHQIAGVLVAGAAQLVARHAVTGLHTVPGGPVWILERLAWLPAYLIVLAGIVAAARRFEK